MKTKIHDGRVIGDWTKHLDFKPTKKQLKEYEKARQNFFKTMADEMQKEFDRQCLIEFGKILDKHFPHIDNDKTNT